MEYILITVTTTKYLNDDLCQNQSALMFRCYDCMEARTTFLKKATMQMANQ